MSEQAVAAASKWKGYFQIIIQVAGLFGVVFGVVTWVAQQKISEISYDISTTKIVDRKEKAPISVLDSSGNSVDGNVYVSTIKIWNSGDKTISIDDVRSPLSITFSGADRVIDLRVERATRGNITKLDASMKPESNNMILISWRYFDPKDGIAVRVVSSSQNSEAITVRGEIYGVDKITQNSSDSRERYLLAKQFISAILCLISGFFAKNMSRFVKRIIFSRLFADNNAMNSVFQSLATFLVLPGMVVAVFFVMDAIWGMFPTNSPF